ncbi:glycosyltransferase involved in cell wall biosynthesis [Dysgonomonas sp. PH5-45]|uniref:glycosyltransferase family 2 protein n=1 Tax=unclassified Dysgonomonas TaxID=2630389 RepID=UPI0024772252|nr:MULTISPECIES: glycosyltransferase family 2 protein [unclassified Dysgonomonas]MDH6355952.1 glycosyltransferase involved in cell wall biosynthesis [Dysgonomonas sp. PH5-45]MDH6388847.1 glycosyltransferase involved in cell wall biosynthesis [Dysgonomonas sp. PH5-37]
MHPESISVIISTYNNPEWLKKTLWGYQNQTFHNFEILIADDGSGKETADMIERFSRESGLNIKHIWHPDNGFQKCEILNKAILASQSEYLIFTDHDCIPRKDFVEGHHQHARKGHFLSGGYFKLPMDISKLIEEQDISSGQVFDLNWLHKHGLKRSFKETKLWNSKAYASFMNTITPANASWNGCNSSCWRSDALLANGFNAEMRYGGLDREFGERLVNAGLKPIQLRYTLIAVHLDHDRPYKTKAQLSANMAIRKNVKRNRIVKTPNGIEQLKG